MNFDALIRSTKKHRIAAEELSKFPEVKRDLALLVDRSVTFAALREVALATERKLLKSVALFDVYEGDKLPEGKKSYALSFVLEDKSRTLDDKTIERVMANPHPAVRAEVRGAGPGLTRKGTTDRHPLTRRVRFRALLIVRTESRCRACQPRTTVCRRKNAISSYLCRHERHEDMEPNYCQSCGMLLTSNEQKGTNADSCRSTSAAFPAARPIRRAGVVPIYAYRSSLRYSMGVRPVCFLK